MSKYNEKRLPYKTQEDLLDILCDILFRLKSKQEMKNFLKDLLNRNERTMLVRRLLIAEKLIDGMTYDDIKALMRCGKSTISRIERWVNFGRNGYKLAISVKKNKNSKLK
ncbi:MAG: YerC/YecD family TrpR-related protein [Parcubacteria group bacterium]